MNHHNKYSGNSSEIEKFFDHFRTECKRAALLGVESSFEATARKRREAREAEKDTIRLSISTCPVCSSGYVLEEDVFCGSVGGPGPVDTFGVKISCSNCDCTTGMISNYAGMDVENLRKAVSVWHDKR